MPIFKLDSDQIYFPPAHLAHSSGILAIGGDLSPERLLLAYKKGIFPWFNPDEPAVWWSPDPRCVILPEKLKVSKSMRQLLRKGKFGVTFDQDFLGVIRACRDVYRPGQEGTWISDEIIDSYYQLHREGFIHSVEVWEEGQLIGGLYGGNLGKAFFGESMFAKASNASKYGLIMLVKNLEEQGHDLIDCQVHTHHLESLGAEMIPRLDFLEAIEQQEQIDRRNWNEVFRTDFDF